MTTIYYLGKKNLSAGNTFPPSLKYENALQSKFTSVFRIAAVLFCTALIIGKELWSFISFLACRLEILFLL